MGRATRLSSHCPVAGTRWRPAVCARAIPHDHNAEEASLSQHYVSPFDVGDPWAGTPRVSKRLLDILERDGQIVPLLVRDEGDSFVVANDIIQRERLHALRHLAWPTILVETAWKQSDL
jgi:hypothetical protein